MGLVCLIDGVAAPLATFEFTLSDPGGPETLTAQIQAGPAPAPGARVRVLDGVEPIWDGIVEEPGQRHTGTRSSANVTAVGQAVALKRNPYSMVYIDRDLSRWGGPTLTRRTVLTTYTPQGAPSPIQDTSGPVLSFQLEGAISAQAQSEGFYDAGPGNLVGRVGFAGDAVSITGAAAWLTQMFASPDGNGSFENVSSDTDGAGVADAVYTLTTPRRYLHFIMRLASSSATVSTRMYNLQGLRVIGNHEVPVQVILGDLDGVRATDVARDAARRSGARFRVDVADNGLVLPQLVYREAVEPEQIIDDMAVLLAWHWGVWPGGVLEDTPVFVLAPPPSEATALVRYEQIQDLDLTEQLSGMYDSALVTYEDGAKTSGRVTVSRRHPRLPDGIDQQLLIDAGAGSAEYAQALGLLTLAAAQQQSRAAGSGRLPAVIQTQAGGPLPAHRLRPGRDRLQIAGMPLTGSMIEDGAGRLDAFRVKRLSVRVEKGEPRTTVEFDTGADLIETLQARVAAATSSG
jgi:hypothetical protein